MEKLLKFCIRFFIAAVLLLAAGLKAYQLATVPSLGEGILHARWFNILVVEFEIFFAFWLLSGLLPKLTRLASVALFSMFTLVSLYKAISGEMSCGCFGSVAVNPWITTAFDTFIVILLSIFREQLIFNFKLSGYEKRKLVAVLFIWFILTTSLVWTMLSLKQQVHATLGTEFIGADGHVTIVLEPQQWIGKTFPLWDRVDESVNPVKQGDWLIIIGRKGCEECHRLVERLATRKIPPLALLELGDGTEINNRESYPTVSIYGILKTEPNWVILTPCLIRCRGGICIAVGEKSVLH